MPIINPVKRSCSASMGKSTQQPANRNKTVSYVQQPPQQQQQQKLVGGGEEVVTDTTTPDTSPKSSTTTTTNTTVEIVLRRAFFGTTHPVLEQYLLDHQLEYLAYSEKKTRKEEQRHYNTTLTKNLIALAANHGIVFDAEHFSFAAIRDRIRFFYWSRVANKKKRKQQQQQVNSSNNTSPVSLSKQQQKNDRSSSNHHN